MHFANFFQVGVLAKPTHGHTIRLSPPLTITANEVELALSVITAVVEKAWTGPLRKE